MTRQKPKSALQEFLDEKKKETWWNAFWHGLASAFDVTGGYHATSRVVKHYDPKISREEAWRRDKEALASDFAAVGGDMRTVMDDIEKARRKALEEVQKKAQPSDKTLK